MTLPAPRPGLVISYAYLWRSDQQAGDSEGRKDRPCAIVVAAQDEDGDTLVYVAPITHSPPAAQTGLEIPPQVKKRLGLDEGRSWIVTNELNRFVWPGYDLRPVRRDRPDVFDWGFLPVELFANLKAEILRHQQANKLGVVRRD